MTLPVRFVRTVAIFISAAISIAFTPITFVTIAIVAAVTAVLPEAPMAPVLAAVPVRKQNA